MDSDYYRILHVLPFISINASLGFGLTLGSSHVASLYIQARDVSRKQFEGTNLKLENMTSIFLFLKIFFFLMFSEVNNKLVNQIIK